jgi:hypothetical protein
MKLQLLQLGLSAYALFRALLTGSSVYIGGPEDQIIFLIPIPTGSPQTGKLKAVRMKCHPAKEQLQRIII